MKKTSLIILTLLSIMPLALTSHAASLTLAWDPSPSQDAIGYKLYYKTGSSTAFDGTGAAQGDSPIDLGNRLSVNLDNLADGTRYTFTATSYNSSGEESPFSNVVTMTTPSGVTDPVVTDPGTTDPGTTDPVVTDPGTTDPGTTDPVVSDPGTTSPEPDSNYVPTLLSPAHHAKHMPRSIDFSWSSPKDRRHIRYTLVFGTDPALTDGTLAATALPGQTSGPPLSSAPALALSGILALAFSRRKKHRIMLAVLLLASGLFLGACGSDGGTDGLLNPPSDQQTSTATPLYTNEITGIDASPFEIYDFDPGTTYYWKVVADDGVNLTESEIHSFTTETQ